MHRAIVKDQDKRQEIRKMDVISLSQFVFRYLKKHLDSNPSNLSFYYPVTSLREALFPQSPDSRGRERNKSPCDHIKLLEAITLLERRGLVVKDLQLSYPLEAPFSPRA